MPRTTGEAMTTMAALVAVKPVVKDTGVSCATTFSMTRTTAMIMRLKITSTAGTATATFGAGTGFGMQVDKAVTLSLCFLLHGYALT